MFQEERPHLGTLNPIYKGLTYAANPQLATFLATKQIKVEETDCHFNVFAKPVTECDKVRDYMTRGGVSYEWQQGQPNAPANTKIGDDVIRGYDESALKAALAKNGYPEKANSAQINRPPVVGLLFILMIYVGTVYGQVAAFIVELFPTRIRYTSVSLPFHLGNGVSRWLSCILCDRDISLYGQHLFWPLVPNWLCSAFTRGWIAVCPGDERKSFDRIGGAAITGGRRHLR